MRCLPVPRITMGFTRNKEIIHSTKNANVVAIAIVDLDGQIALNRKKTWFIHMRSRDSESARARITIKLAVVQSQCCVVVCRRDHTKINSIMHTHTYSYAILNQTTLLLNLFHNEEETRHFEEPNFWSRREKRKHQWNRVWNGKEAHTFFTLSLELSHTAKKVCSQPTKHMCTSKNIMAKIGNAGIGC